MKARPSSHRTLSFSKKLIEMISSLTGYGGILAILASMLIVVYEVFARYLLKWATVWEIEAAIFLLLFTTFVGSAFALKHDAHIRMDIVTVRLKTKTRKKLVLVTSIVSLAFCAIVSIRGWQMWWEAFRLGWRSDSVWSPPLAIPYIFLPIGFVCICLQYIVNIFKEIESLRSE